MVMSYVLWVMRNSKPTTRNIFSTYSSNSSLALKLAKFHTSAGWCFQYRPCVSFQQVCACSAAEWRSGLKDNHHLNKQRNQYRCPCYGSGRAIESLFFYPWRSFLPARVIYYGLRAHKKAQVPFLYLHRLRHSY